MLTRIFGTMREDWPHMSEYFDVSCLRLVRFFAEEPAKKGINTDKMSNEEYDEFFRSADPKAYEEMQAELDEFMSLIKTMAEQEGLDLVHKSESGDHPGKYAVSLKDIFTRNNPETITTEEFVKPKKKKTKSRKSKKK